MPQMNATRGVRAPAKIVDPVIFFASAPGDLHSAAPVLLRERVMLSLFDHHISLRAIFFAVAELCIFAGIFQLLRYVIFGMSTSTYVDPDRYGILLALCGFISFGTAAGCGLYNRDVRANTGELVVRLLSVSAMMYGLMALAILISQFTLVGTSGLGLYNVIALSSVVGYLVAAVLFRHKALQFRLNDTLLDRRILVLGTEDCTTKVEHLNGVYRNPFTMPETSQRGGMGNSPRRGEPVARSHSVRDSSTDLLHQARRMGAKEIVVTSRDRDGLPIDSLLACKLDGITVTEFTSFWERQTGQIDLEKVNPNWLIFTGGFRMSWLMRCLKRAFDVTVALIVLLATLPITLLAAIAIKCDSAGPVFYRQERVGQHGNIFTIFKFRSMRIDAEKDGIARWAQSNDSRITRVGNVLRRCRIDEIPQIANVLQGNMSFVGPRPERPTFVDALARTIPYYRIRHCIKPGITGWAQINYPYGASNNDAKAKLAYDLYYAKNWSLFLDTVILFQTVSVVLWPVRPVAEV